jgi:hypothetical protein
MITSVVQDKTKPDVVFFLRDLLTQYKIVSEYGARKKFKIEKLQSFFSLFRAFFLVWFFNCSKLENQPNFCFLKLNKKNTLVLLPPTRTISGYINENNGRLFKNSLFEGIEQQHKPSDCCDCAVLSFIKFNLSQFKKNQISFEENHRTCARCFQSFQEKISEKVIQDTETGFLFGGLPFCIKNVPSDLVKEITDTVLAEASSKSELNETLSALLLAFLSIYIGNQKKYGGAKTNCAIKLDTYSDEDTKIKVFSNEIDAVVYSQDKKRLIAIEITSLADDAFRQSSEERNKNKINVHLGKTVQNFNFLSTYCQNSGWGFRGIYLTLIDFSKEIKGLPIYFALAKNRFYAHIKLNKIFEQFKASLSKDEAPYKILMRCFDFFLGAIKKKIKDFN